MFIGDFGIAGVFIEDYCGFVSVFGAMDLVCCEFLVLIWCGHGEAGAACVFAVSVQKNYLGANLKKHNI